MEELKILWKSCLGEIETELGKNYFRLYFGGSSLLRLEDGVAEVGLANEPVRAAVNARYYQLVKRAIERQTGKDHSIVFSVAPSKRFKKTKFQKLKEKDEAETVGTLFEEESKEGEIARALSSAGLNEYFTFETFCVSSSNQLAHAAAKATAESPGTTINPLFLYGGVGVGKTHLMQAVGNVLCRQDSKKKILYIPAETFTNEFVDSLPTKTTSSFRKKYRSVDVLLIDDIQFVSGKEKTQEELFHTFNVLVLQKKKQVVLTSDRPPEKIERLEDRLRSRFQGGMVADISKPDFELKVAVALTKARMRGVELPRDVAAVIASNVDNMRTLEGVLLKLLTQALVAKEELTPEFAVEVIGKRKDGEEETKPVEPEKILKTVTSYYGVKARDIKGGRRQKELALTRQLIMYLLKNEAGLTYQEVGRMLGGRHHTTVMHGADKIAMVLSREEKLRRDLEEIKMRFRNSN